MQHDLKRPFMKFDERETKRIDARDLPFSLSLPPSKDSSDPSPTSSPTHSLHRFLITLPPQPSLHKHTHRVLQSLLRSRTHGHDRWLSLPTLEDPFRDALDVGGSDGGNGGGDFGRGAARKGEVVLGERRRGSEGEGKEDALVLRFVGREGFGQR